MKPLCIHGMEIEYCALHGPKPKPTRSETKWGSSRVGSTGQRRHVYAEYPGTCGRCGGQVRVGERIENDPSFGWSHMECED